MWLREPQDHPEDGPSLGSGVPRGLPFPSGLLCRDLLYLYSRSNVTLLNRSLPK